MKKVLFLLLMAVMTAGKLSAQDILGEWVTTFADAEQTVAFTLGFNKDKTANIRVVIDATDPEIGSMTMRIELSGTYSVDGDQLKLVSDAKKADVKLIGMKLKGEMGEAAKDPATEKMIRSMLEQQLGTQKVEMLAGVPINTTLTIVSKTDDKLTLLENGTEEAMEFMKINK